MSQYSHLSEPDPELPSIPEMAGPITRDRIPAVREMFDIPLSKRLEIYKSRLPAESTYKLEDHQIAVEGGEIRVRIISPTPTDGEDSEYPVLVYFHGGGWVAGSIDTKDFDLRIYSVEDRLTTFNVEYRLAPDHPFPTGLNDSYTALKWTVENCKIFSGSLKKGFVLAGASAGANLVAAMTHRALKDPFFEHHKITGNILQIPVLVHPAAYPPEYINELLSFEQNKDAPIIGKDMMNVFYDCLSGPPADPDVSPLLADHTGLPPAYFQICGLDPLRDEGLLYERLLREKGTPTKLDIYPGLPHGFSTILRQLKASKKWEDDFRGGLKWILNPSA
ncbi:Esterase/lipase/thioesterase [Mycena venus]|uniref:Esterase/lipase/thioesterase n=1 Tax=Mycena venus TaxID=2733690 RepID=A0A8H6YYK7_9AGAR|nr:Esterase/lipase/thioesterase [Mycena venus]